MTPWFLGISFLISSSLAGIILVFLISGSLPIFEKYGWEFIFGEEWYVGETYGALPMIYGTTVVTGIALGIALPLGIGTAVVTSEVVGRRMRYILKSVMEIMAGVPGIVYGLLGMLLVTTWIRDLFGLVDGNCLLTAGLLLGVMILPTVMTLSEDAIHVVPNFYREQAYALGLQTHEVIIYAVLPQAIPGILGAIFLGTTRAMGETVAVMLVIGSLDRIPDPFYNLFAPAQSIASKIGREAAESIGVGLHWNALVALGLILFGMVMTLTWLAERVGWTGRLQ
tara:strand:- start:3342 stop:4187 length:846 start_codon:yes stop_codon:yes gene_type:complete